jgi:ankyrin repeat protein
LLQAANDGAGNIIEMLLHAGASVAPADSNGLTPLWMASAKGHTDAARLFLKHGADPNTTDKNATTSLGAAAQLGDADPVKLLLDNGADTLLPNVYGWTPLYDVVARGHGVIFQQLISAGTAIDTTTSELWTALNLASHYGCISMVRSLLENDSNTEIANKVGRSNVTCHVVKMAFDAPSILEKSRHFFSLFELLVIHRQCRVD